jgi:WD40 repeat protein
VSGGDRQFVVTVRRPDTLAEDRTVEDPGWSHAKYRPDGEQLAVIIDSAVDRVQLLDPATFRPDAVQLGGMPTSISAHAAYSADGRYLAASFQPNMHMGNGSNPVLVWDLSTREAPIFEVDAAGRWLPGVALSPDGSRLYVWETNDEGEGGALTAYDVADGEITAQTDTVGRPDGGCCPAGPGDLAVSPDGRTIALAQVDGVLLYHAETLWRVGRQPAPRPGGVEFSHDGELLAAGGSDGVIVWDVSSGEQLLAVGGGSPAFSADDATLYTTSELGLAEWDLAGDRRSVEVINEPGGEPFVGRPARVRAAVEPPGARLVPDTPAPDGEAVAYQPVPASEPIRILDTARHELIETPPPATHPTGLAWKPPDFDTLAVADGARGTVQLIDRHSGDVVAERRLSDYSPTAIAFTADGDRLLVGGLAGTLVVLDGDSLRPVGSLIDLGSRILGIYPSADGRRAAVLLVGDGDLVEPRGYAVVDLNDGVIDEEGSLGFGHAAGAISPDGTRLAVVSGSGEVGIRQLDGPGWVRPPLAGEVGMVRTVSYAPDGAMFVVADTSGRVQLWDATTGTLRARLLLRRPGVSASAVFLPDGHTVSIATADGAVYEWDTRVERAIEVACAAAGRNMTQTEWREAFPERPYRETCPAD